MTEKEKEIREAQSSFEQLGHPDYEEPVTTIGYLLSLLDQEREKSGKFRHALTRIAVSDDINSNFNRPENENAYYIEIAQKALNMAPEETAIRTVQSLISEADAKDTLAVTAEQFRAFVREAIERINDHGGDGVDVIAERMTVSKPTVRRWAYGITAPHEIMIKHAVRNINYILNQRGIH